MADLGTLAGIASTIAMVKDKWTKGTTPSLTAYTKQANIMSRLYIEDSILRDDICVPLVGVLNQLYVGYILAALNMDACCANGRTVKEQFQTVASENQNVVKDILENFGTNKYKPSFEAGPVVEEEPATQRLPVSRVIEITLQGIRVLTKGKTEGTVDTDINGNTTINPTRPQPPQNPTIDDLINKPKKSVHDSNMEAEQSTYQFKAYLFVQLIPYILKPEIVDGYIGANFTPPVSARWRAYKAGEISFWKDFVFAGDLIKKQAKILKKDKDNIIGDMLNRQHNALFKWWEGIFGMTCGGSGSHNTANTMLITNKITFDRACRENRINFADKAQRQKFFNKTWSMIICVVDPLYNTVDMYFNGLDVKGTYTFAMINKVGAKGNDSFDLKEVMSAFSQGMSPKF